MKKDSKDIKSILFLLLFLIVGIILIVVGSNINKEEHPFIQEYVETKGSFISAIEDKDISSDNDTTLYKLIYEYEVNDNAYRVTSNISTLIVPRKDTNRVILYDSTNPRNAVIRGMETGSLFIMIGVLFILATCMILIPSVFYLFRNSHKKTPVVFIEKIKTLIGGLFFFIIPYYILYAITGEINVITMIASSIFYSEEIFNNILLMVLIIFMLFGVFAIIYSFFINKKRIEKQRKVVENYTSTIETKKDEAFDKLYDIANEVDSHIEKQ